MPHDPRSNDRPFNCGPRRMIPVAGVLHCSGTLRQAPFPEAHRMRGVAKSHLRQGKSLWMIVRNAFPRWCEPSAASVTLFRPPSHRPKLSHCIRLTDPGRVPTPRARYPNAFACKDVRRMMEGEVKRSNPLAPMAAVGASSFMEMNDLADFDAIVSSDGSLSICGFGSLLSVDNHVTTMNVILRIVKGKKPEAHWKPERSARNTFPELQNFRTAVLHGFRRVFGHVAPIFFERGIAKAETGEISSLSVEPCPGETLIVSVFEINKLEITSFIEREHEFRFLAVVPEDFDGKPYPSAAVLCTRYSDEEYFHVRCKGDEKVFFERYGRYNVDKIWRDDILPCRVYLRHCVLAAKNLGREAFDNFLDHTYLGNRKTTIRQYLASAGAGILEEEPPDTLKHRYGG